MTKLSEQDKKDLLEILPDTNPANYETTHQEAIQRAIQTHMALVQPSKRQSKYNVSPALERTYNGILYDSKKEMKYYIQVLEPLLKAGELDYVLYHVPFIVGNDPITKYEADFVTLAYGGCSYTSPIDWAIQVIEIKGYHTASGDRKIKLFRKKFPKIEIKII